MKQSLTLLLVLFSLASHAQKLMKLTINIKNKTTDTIYLRSQTSSKPIIANQKGFFEYQTEVTEDLQVLTYNQNKIILFVNNEFDLTITTDHNQFKEQLTFSGKGAKENNIVKQVFSVFDNIEDLFNLPNQSDFDAFMSQQKEKDRVLFADTSLSESFKGMMQMIMSQNYDSLERYYASRQASRAYNGQPIIEFNYQNHKGGKTNIKDYLGQYIYLDIWATWCGPCLMEIPHLKAIEHEFKDANIVFMSISVDQPNQTDKWKKMVEDQQLGGVQLLADNAFNSAIIKTYNIMGIPRFMLIDKTGKIINSDAPRPSDPALKKLLLTLK